MTRPFDVVTFDCYGTLIDWEAGITEAFRDAAVADGVSLDPAAVLQALFDTRPAAERPDLSRDPHRRGGAGRGPPRMDDQPRACGLPSGEPGSREAVP